MSEKVINFFASLKDPKYLTMKLLSDVFKKMGSGDEASQRIIDNIDVLSQYNFILEGDIGTDNYVISPDDLSEVVLFLSSCCSDVDACHEFGHILIDLFARGERPENYDEVILNVRRRMLEREEEIYALIEGFSDEVYSDFIASGDLDRFLEKSSIVREDFFKRHPDADEDDFNQVVRLYCFANAITFNSKAENYNKVANIVDSIFLNDGTFYMAYGNDEHFPVLAMHDDEYFEEYVYGEEQASFEEQFADYVALRVYGDRLSYANEVCLDILGDEWFDMMDKHYNSIVDRISEKGKEYQKKI